MSNIIDKKQNIIEISDVRSLFPIFEKEIKGKSLVYLDTAASAQKPSIVIDSIKNCYQDSYANIHRGLYDLSENLTEKYEDVRLNIKKFINAESEKEIIFLRGATEGINLVASSWGAQNLKQDDEIILTTLEHHSNIIPWQLIAKKTGAVIKVVPIDKNGNLEIDKFNQLISSKTKIVSLTQASNAIGTITPIKEIIETAHKFGAVVLIDGCQGIVHLETDVRALDCDFYVFSGHKLYGPSGIGVLYGKKEILEDMPPYQGGGEMIDKVTFEASSYAPLPHKFEAGTPSIADTIGLGEAINFVNRIGYESIRNYENKLVNYAKSKLESIDRLQIIGNPYEKTSLISFIIDGIHSYDVGSILNEMGISLRVGHHCAQPLMQFYNLSGTLRASFGVYNNLKEVDILYEGLNEALKVF
ncbi:cysteine desulfurase [Alphaproteobacteria bacterium]|nr:cysteine desulfurase [Alphaproteobacteria bacterium]